MGGIRSSDKDIDFPPQPVLTENSLSLDGVQLSFRVTSGQWFRWYHISPVDYKPEILEMYFEHFSIALDKDIKHALGVSPTPITHNKSKSTREKKQ